MKELKKCPCGKTPKKLFIVSADTADKYAYVSTADCCGEWEVEYRNDYKIGDESYELGVKAWNNAARNNALSVEISKLEELIAEYKSLGVENIGAKVCAIDDLQKLINEAKNG